MLFTGDTLFKMAIGRTDLLNGSYKDIINSLHNVLMNFDDDTVVYPGHGTKTSIGFERGNNPYLGKT